MMTLRTTALSLFTAALLVFVVTACDSDDDAQRLSNLVAVADAGYTNLVINGDTATVIETGESTQLSVEAFTDDAVVGTAISSSRVDWSSADTLIAEVNSNTGLVFGRDVDGEVAITASFGNLSATTVVRVSSAQLEDIEIVPADDLFALNECSDSQFLANGVYQGEAERRDITDSVVWGVDQATAAFDATGLLRVTSAGVLSVNVTRPAFQDKPEVTQTTEITVLDNLGSIEIVPDAGELRNGSPLQYRAFAIYNDGADRAEITDNVVWDIEDSATSGDFAGVANGLVTPSRAGDGVLTAECAGVSASLNIVAAGSGEFAELSILPANEAREFPLTVTWRGEEIQEQFIARALFVDQAGGLDVSDEAEWFIVSRTENVFTLGNDSDDKGELIIRGTGTVRLRATWADDDDEIYRSPTVTVVSQLP